MEGLLAQFGMSGTIALAGVIGTFYVMKSRIEDLLARDEKRTIELSKMGTKLESVTEELSLAKQKLGVVSGMLRPEAVAEHTRWVAMTTKDIEYMRRDIEIIDQRTKCKECEK